MTTSHSKSIVNILTSATLVAASLVGCSTTSSTSGSSAKSNLDTAKSKLAVETYVGSEKGFLVTSHLILGPTEAILIDSQFTRSDAKRVIAMIQKSGRRLKTVFVTHGHPDHYLGIATLREAFPATRYVATAETVDDIKATGPGKIAYWKPIYGEELPSAVPTVDVLNNNDLVIDGEALILKQIAPGESDHASVIYAPSLKAAFTGDMVYDHVHLWLAEAVGRTDSWENNLKTLKSNDEVQTLYVGHQKTNRINSKNLIDENLNYIDRAVTIFAHATTAEQGATELKAAFPDYGLPVIADVAASSFIQKK